MTDEPLRACRTVALASEKYHDKICEDFERAWKDGKKPRIEDWLEKVPEEERPVLFALLAKREKAFRPDETLIDEFSIRFPSLSEWIGTLFNDSTDFEIDQDRSGTLPAIPGYRMLERIAFGGMGVIYKAVHIGLDRVVALKMVPRRRLLLKTTKSRDSGSRLGPLPASSTRISSTSTILATLKGFPTSRWNISKEAAFPRGSRANR